MKLYWRFKTKDGKWKYQAAVADYDGHQDVDYVVVDKMAVVE
jgi:hypothetical protein